MANHNGNGKSLESWIWAAACSIRGAKNAPKYKNYILPLISPSRYILTSDARTPVMAPVNPPVAVVVLIRLIGSIGPLGNSEILANFDLSDRTHLRERYIGSALADGLVERTIPDKPTCRLQKYWLTEKGRRLLEQMDKDGGRS